MRIPKRARHFIGCEGQSEQSYAKLLGIKAEEEGLWLHLDIFDAKGGDPLSIVEACIKQHARKVRDAGKFVTSAILLDGDRFGDDLNRDLKARALAGRAGVRLVVMDFDFECHLYRHVDGKQHDHIGAGNSLNSVKSVWPDYSKPADAKWLNERLTLMDIRRASTTHMEFLAMLQGIGLAPA